MAVATFIDEFTVLSTDIIGTTKVRTGYGFAPKALIVVSCRSAAPPSVGGETYNLSLGFGAGTNQFCVSGSSLDGAALSSAARRQNATAIMQAINTLGADNGSLKLNTLDSDGVTFEVLTQFVVTTRVFVFAYGGSDITNAFVSSSSLGAAAGNESVAGVGFQPDIVFFLCTGTLSSNATHSNIGFGYMTATKQGTLATKSLDAVATTSTRRYHNDVEAISTFVGNTGQSISRRAAFVSMNSDGFTINHLETVAAATFGFLCIKGGSWTGGNVITVNNTTTTIPITGLPSTPRGLLAFTHGGSENTQDVTTTGSFFSIGFAKDAASRVSTGLHDANAVTTCQVSTINDNAELIAFVDLDVVGFLLDVQSVDALGYTLIMDNADDGRNAFVQFVAVGDNVSGGGGNQAQRDYRRWRTRAVA